MENKNNRPNLKRVQDGTFGVQGNDSGEMNGQNEFYNNYKKKNLTRSYAIYPGVNTDSTFSVASPPTPSQPPPKNTRNTPAFEQSWVYWLFATKKVPNIRIWQEEWRGGGGVALKKALGKEIVPGIELELGDLGHDLRKHRSVPVP